MRRIDRWSRTGDQLVVELTAPVEPEWAGGLVVVTSPPSRRGNEDRARQHLATRPGVVAAQGWDGADHDLVDLTVDDDAELHDVERTVARCPLAATALALHLRASDRRTVEDGLVAESALYSALQAGPEHRAWRETTPRRPPRPATGRPPVRVERHGDVLHLTLDRPEARNAVSTALRDALLEALAVAEADPALAVELRGAGPAFCAGGDLDEFGTAPDPATAHAIRLRRSLGAALHRLAPRTTVHVHGPTVGAGIELAAFAGRVVAAPDTTIGLPELALGLVPGAGGTVSLPARIGRHRTAWLALTGRTVDAPTAHTWGLVDALL